MTHKFDSSKVYSAIENFVGTHNADEVKKHYKIAREKDDWRQAIMIHIASGRRLDLEEEFPEWADANPANFDWP
ncbi:hypothetical protein [Aeromonas caviae]|uniref:hypothetical protein n=1 Tax=Aeromonas caviae TaxID=648 RepID=UPI002447B064|nr:hypothetical protein [Aeromonas caviae]MDH1848003.1 hypothetical protein [Aeromonas caviae]